MIRCVARSLARGSTSLQGDADDLVVVAHVNAAVGKGGMRPNNHAASAARRGHVGLQDVRAADLLHSPTASAGRGSGRHDRSR